ncbi:MAG: hypothetical protein LKF75_04400 [Bacilli bacterium]|jgi:hypothetical protein|nr:hypothetical protein [Bacilli bacterium]MCH4210328.1 hypothetical protein [Bacilli bacterium]MCH4228915.1 hypothetical protein [Bacilli bacterium]MCH4278104.1 hypothetical protein [Bacilli bacterium]MCI2055420.1 hypothetical protein [Bacilli bacterium]
MIEINDNSIAITKEDGTVENWKIYFYYHNPERKKDYYLIYNENDPDSLLVMSSKDGKELSDVSEEEFAEAQEMLETYEKDPKIASMK